MYLMLVAVEVKQSIFLVPYSTSQFDIVTAFDTINYWENIKKSVMEIYRVLKVGGKFLIINGYPKKGTKWWILLK